MMSFKKDGKRSENTRKKAGQALHAAAKIFAAVFVTVLALQALPVPGLPAAVPSAAGCGLPDAFPFAGSGLPDVVPFAGIIAYADAASAPEFHYEHDPRLNPTAMADIVADAKAVYGFAPKPDSARLGAFAGYDWSDPEVVAAGRENRLEYHNSMAELYSMLEELKKQGKSTEETARALSAKRNELRLAADKDDPDMLAATKKSNLEKYGNENGPTADSLYEKYGSWETVIDKAFSTNPGMDACLGLYDDYYELYEAAGQIPSEKSYTVQAGDYLARIAGEMLGDRKRWPEIYELNKGSIRNADLIYPGQVLILP